MTNYKEYIELLQTRRSIRAFTEQPVNDEDIKKIIDSARYAPSGMNFQPWEYIVIRDPKLIENLVSMNEENMHIPYVLKKMMKKKFKSKSMPNIKSAKNASVLIVAVGDTRKQITLPGQMYKYKNGHIKLGKKLPIFDVDGLWYSSMANSFIQMITAAASLGLSSQYCTVVSSSFRKKQVKELLGIPQYMKVYDSAAIGYAAYQPRQKSTRPLEEIIHHDHYDINKAQSDKYIYNRALDRTDMKYLNETEFSKSNEGEKKHE